VSEAGTDDDTDRREQLTANLAAVRGRIADACRAVGRDPSDVTLIVVTKFFPADDVRILADLGVTDVGENRHQEAEAKAGECRDLGLRWHFIGRLQSNKAAAVASYSHVVESVDRAKLLTGLARGTHQVDGSLDVLVQVDLDAQPEVGRGGAAPRDVPRLAERVAQTDGLRLRGVMGIAPLGEDPLPSFEKLASLAEEVRAVDPQALWISAGMSGDLEEAVKVGATHVRIGSAVLGARPSLR
jgi:pyridoxal phosphate enzyme (YggS family)